MENPFVTTAWLAAHLDDPNVVAVDASWYMPAANRDPRAEFLLGHIPNAVFFGIDDIADHTTDLPHMLLPPDQFAREVGALGIGDGMTIVAYDEAGLFSAPRLWWELLAMGATDTRLLEGGGPQWRAEGRPLEAGPGRRPPKTFTSRPHPELVADLALVRDLVVTGARQIADARPAGRFSGEVPEPRPGLAAGHMPGARNVPFSELTRDGRMKSAAELKTMFAAAGLDLDRPIVTTCGSGITAATLALALHLAGAPTLAVYDGSWAEWGARDDAPVVKG